MGQRIFFQSEKKLKNRDINITCRSVIIEDLSVLSKYYQKEIIGQACKNGCPNYGQKWSCPPFSKPYYELMEGYEKAVIICFSTDMSNYQDIKNKYIAIKAANVTLKNLVERSARKIERKMEGYALLSGSCRLCRTCARKNMQGCKHPKEMRYSIEAAYLNVQNICKDLLDFNLLWYEKKVLPSYTSTVALVFCRGKMEERELASTLQEEVKSYGRTN